MSNLDISIRPLHEGDVDFVLSSWLRSYRDSQPEVRTNDYYCHQRELVTRLLAGGVVLVATPADDPDLILGWVAADATAGVVHFVYTRQAYRRLGIARQLVARVCRGENAILCCTHLTSVAAKIKRAHDGQIRYVPQLLATT